jgi:hypothetical protein
MTKCETCEYRSPGKNDTHLNARLKNIEDNGKDVWRAIAELREQGQTSHDETSKDLREIVVNVAILPRVASELDDHRNRIERLETDKLVREGTEKGRAKEHRKWNKRVAVIGGLAGALLVEAAGPIIEWVRKVF